MEVDARHISQRCPRCGHTERANRPDRDHFRCRRCGLAGPADVVAGGQRARSRTLGVGVCHRTRTLPLNRKGEGGCAP
ncbi:zinc ribbon domain-containing protein [Streptomyces asiaticus]|uniref:zinc ribbon domain-containing protein n=1 Tax=Streptomyces asiaticus TaxID=114695 RepID=UPI0027E34548|nr:zinc ribbon domain-containing protein [Streptomyces asiaticus]